MKSIAYWVETELIAGPPVVGIVTHPGYSVYILSILGVWKLLLWSIVAPGLPRLKEWAYAGVFFELSGAAGPHPISQEELRAAFNPSTGWNVAAIEPDRIQTRYHDDGAPAWLATIKRI